MLEEVVGEVVEVDVLECEVVAACDEVELVAIGSVCLDALLLLLLLVADVELLGSEVVVVVEEEEERVEFAVDRSVCVVLLLLVGESCCASAVVSSEAKSSAAHGRICMVRLSVAGERRSWKQSCQLTGRA